MKDEIRYQLLHRTVSAINTSQDFHASAAVMLVQSFSPEGRWRDDFTAFCDAMAAEKLTSELCIVKSLTKPRLYLAWCAGDCKYLNVEIPSHPQFK
jgi:hypothetical protein